MRLSSRSFLSHTVSVLAVSLLGSSVFLAACGDSQAGPGSTADGVSAGGAMASGAGGAGGAGSAGLTSTGVAAAPGTSGAAAGLGVAGNVGVSGATAGASAAGAATAVAGTSSLGIGGTTVVSQPLGGAAGQAPIGVAGSTLVDVAPQAGAGGTTVVGTGGAAVNTAGSAGELGGAGSTSMDQTGGATAGDANVGGAAGADSQDNTEGGAGGEMMEEMGGAGAPVMGEPDVDPVGDGALLSRDTNIRIMPSGDSITEAQPWRQKLASKLQSEGISYEFVGGAGSGDLKHEGHGGFLVTESAGDMQGWASANPADVVLFQWGTNDVWNGVSTDQILSAYATMVDSLRAANPNVIVMVGQITPMSPDDSTCSGCTCSACLGRVDDLNGAIPAWASGLSTSDSPVIVVDLFSGFDVQSDTSDRVHPNDSGAEKQAEAWLQGLLGIY